MFDLWPSPSFPTSEDCQSHNQNYAYGNIEEVIDLGGENGLILYGAKRTICVAHLNVYEMKVVQGEGEEGGALRACTAVKQAVQSLSTGSGADIQWMLPLGKTLFYYHKKSKFFCIFLFILF